MRRPSIFSTRACQRTGPREAGGMAALGIGRLSVLTEADAVIPGLDDFVLADYLA